MLVAVLNDVMLGILVAGLSTRSHVGEHGQHARRCEDAGHHSRRGGDDGEDDGEPDAAVSESGAGGLGEGEVLGGDDLREGEVAGHRRGDRQVDGGADGEGDHDGPPGVAVGVDDLAAAVGDGGGEALVGEDGERDRGQEALRRGVDARGGRPGGEVGGVGEPKGGVIHGRLSWLAGG